METILSDQEEEEGDVKDRHLRSSTREEGITLGDDTDTLDAMERALSRSVIERQNEERAERTNLLIQQFLEREGTLKRRRMYYRFKAIVRLMLLAFSLKNYGTAYFERMQGVDHTQEATTLPAFDVNQYRRQKLTPFPHQVKRMLAKPRWLRTEEELGQIFRTLSKLSFFYKYPQAILRLLSAVVRYNFIEENRIVLRQGHMPTNFYYVLSGKLCVFVDEKDEAGNVVSHQVAKLQTGDSFGELALIHNTPRTATVITKYATELLSIEKDDFDDLLKDMSEKEWAGRYNIICQLPEFNVWSKEQIEDLSNNCTLQKYDENKVILGNVSGSPDTLFFIIDGKCRVIEELRVTAAAGLRPGAAMALCALPVDADSKEVLAGLSPWASVVKRFLHILTLGEGQYFGAGEDLQRRYVVSLGKVECLQIPHTYLHLQEHDQWLQVLLDRLISTVPTHKYVFDDFVKRAAWRAYKKDLIANVIDRSRKLKPTNMEDVPFSIRHDEETQNYNTIQMKTIQKRPIHKRPIKKEYLKRTF